MALNFLNSSAISTLAVPLIPKDAWWSCCHVSEKTWGSSARTWWGAWATQHTHIRVHLEAMVRSVTGLSVPR